MYGNRICCSIVALGKDATDNDEGDGDGSDDDDGSMDDKSFGGGGDDANDLVVQGNNDSSVNPSPTKTPRTSDEVTRHRFKMAFMAVVRTIHPSTSRKHDPGE